MAIKWMKPSSKHLTKLSAQAERKAAWAVRVEDEMKEDPVQKKMEEVAVYIQQRCS